MSHRSRRAASSAFRIPHSELTPQPALSLPRRAFLSQAGAGAGLLGLACLLHDEGLLGNRAAAAGLTAPIRSRRGPATLRPRPRASFGCS